jgi:hypothetical protein
MSRWLIAITITLIVITYFLDSGWDFLAYSAAVNAFRIGADPYFAHYTYGSPAFPFVYPPHTLILFTVLCIAGAPKIYFLSWTIFLVLSYGIARRIGEADDLLLVTLLLTGSLGTFWSFLTGNIGIVYLFLLSAVFYAAVRGKYFHSAVLMALLSSFTLFPIVFSGLFLFVKRAFIDRITILLTSFLSLGAIFAATYAISPKLFVDYLDGLRAPESPLYEEGEGLYNPSLSFLITDIARTFHLDTMYFIPLLAGGAIAAVLALAYLYFRRNRADTLKLASFGFIAIFLLLPRLKPYYYTLVLLPLYFLIRGYDLRRKCICLSLVSVFPLACHYLYIYSPNLVTSYSQYLSVAFAFLFIGISGIRARA